ncbi:MAG TPA: aldo/keto reductase [Bacillota bacterium]|nr:aldo/keto reductase [Bacillota bacterium]
MERRRLGRTGLSVSPVMFGGIINTDETQESADSYVAKAVSAGVNYFDVAPSYGNAEVRLAPALKHIRNDVILACKTTERGAEGARRELLASLDVLGVKYFDIYQLHALAKDADLDTAFAPGGAMETVLWAKKEGLIRHVGFSTHNENVALRALDRYDFETVLFPMNWAMGLTTGWGDRIAQASVDKGFGLLCMKTLVHRKWLPGEERTFPKSWCKPLWEEKRLAVCGMKYGFLKGGVSMVPPGNIKHFEFALEHVDECLNDPLTQEEMAFLQSEAEKVREHLIFDVTKM